MIVKLGKTSVTEQVNSTKVIATLLELIEEHPWNTLLQLKTHAIFEELIDGDSPAESKINAIYQSGLIGSLVKLGAQPDYTFRSERRVRHGHMGFVIKLANLVKKRQEQDDLSDLP